MNKICGKEYILMRDNTPSHISEKTIEFIKRAQINEWKEWPAYIQDLNLIENVWGLIKSQLMKNEINKKSELIIEIKNDTMKLKMKQYQIWLNHFQVDLQSALKMKETEFHISL